MKSLVPDEAELFRTAEFLVRLDLHKLYLSQLPVLEQALETASLMLGSDKSRSYCLEMICGKLVLGGNIYYLWVRDSISWM